MDYFAFHGLGSSANTFDDIAKIFASQGHEVRPFDFAGFGDRKKEIISKDPFDTILKEALYYTEGPEEKISLIAHSMGIVPAVLLAEQIPHRIHQIVIMEGNLTEHDEGAFSRKLAAAEKDEDIIEAIEGASEKFRNGNNPGWKSWVPEVADVKPNVMRQYSQELIDAADSRRLYNILKDLKCKILYIYGDGYKDHPNVGLLEDIDVETAYIEGAGHFMHVDEPEICAQLILKYADIKAPKPESGQPASPPPPPPAAP